MITKEQITLEHIKYWMVKFEQAVSSYALIDGYPPEYQKGIRRNYRQVKEQLNTMLEVVMEPYQGRSTPTNKMNECKGVVNQSIKP